MHLNVSKGPHFLCSGKEEKNLEAPRIHLLLGASLASNYHQETITEAIDLDFWPKTAKGNSRKVLIMESPKFDFGMDDIDGICEEMKTLIKELSKIYAPWRQEQDRKEKEEKRAKRSRHGKESSTTETKK